MVTQEYNQNQRNLNTNQGTSRQGMLKKQDKEELKMLKTTNEKRDKARRRKKT